MTYEPDIPESQKTTLHTGDGDPVIAPKGGQIFFTLDGDCFGLPGDVNPIDLSFSPDGDPYIISSSLGKVGFVVHME